MERQIYYSQRTGKNSKTQRIDLDTLKKLFLTVYDVFFDKDYFRGSFGYYSHNSFRDYSDGPLGSSEDISRMLFLKLRKDNIWPIENHIHIYSEDDLFDIIEFCYDNISIPIIKYDDDDVFTGYSERLVGYDSKQAQQDFRSELNKHLKDYEEGFEIDSNGFIVKQAGFGLETLFEAKLPTKDDNIIKPIEHAIMKYRNRASTISDRKEAVRSIVDVLEYLRPQVKDKVDKKDENDLFNIANNFGIRHHNLQQKTDYDEQVWLSWMFYFYLATVHTFLRIINRK